MSNLYSIFLSIPSPSANSIELGPLTLRYYGLMIGLGVIAAVFIGTKRWVAQGGVADDVSYVAMFGVLGGLFGAKLYHVLTSIPDRGFIDIFKIWEPGLGIPGGLAVGLLAGWYAARRKSINPERMLHAVVPGIPVAQAVGRLGNWFNQELFGRPSDLPWAVEIDQNVRTELALRSPDFAQYADAATFHPTFAYEALLNLTLAGALLIADKLGFIKRAMMLPLYVAGYGLIRFVVESFRSDEAAELFGVRFNLLLAAIATVGGLAVALRTKRGIRDRA